MIELEVYVATQSWVNREYRRRLSTHPCGVPVLRISVAEVLFPIYNTWVWLAGSPGPSCIDLGPQA